MFLESAIQGGLWSWRACDPGRPESTFAHKSAGILLAGMSGRVWYA
ncbi:MAG: hypothetical protein ACQERT_00880 [Thermodesulfobacteriota bacterium]